MKKIKTVLSISFILLTVFLCACSKQDSGSDQANVNTQITIDDLAGKWKGTGNEISTLTLGKDGSYKDVAEGVSIVGTYTIDAASGTMTVNESEYGMVFSYSYELSGNDLTLQMNGGLPRTFTKQ